MLSRRATGRERMDVEPATFEDYSTCLRDLERVNVLTFAYRPTLAFLSDMARAAPGRPLSVLDVACGRGDMLRRIDGWARRRKLSVALTGCDLDPRAVRAAREAAAGHPGISWRAEDVLAHDRPGEFDVVISSLFAHHLDDDGVAAFLRWMERNAALGWFVNDLRRHPVPYGGFWLLSRLAGWHRFVRHDGPLSIARAFSAADWRRSLREAGVPEDTARIERRFPYRLCVRRVRAP
ncbi:MAG: methyltransferase domain-containing protein [Acetobacterales bacterium]